MNRSFLFVPADSERKMRKAAEAGADALIYDLEDSVSADARPAARQLIRENIAEGTDIWVRINPLDSDDAELDLNAVVAMSPQGIVLPKPRGVADVQALAQRLSELEAEHGITAGQTRLLPICTEHPQALFSLDGYVNATDRLAGLCWGAEDLSAAVGARRNRDDNGNWLPPYELARSLCLFAAAAAGVPAFDTVYTNFRDAAGLSRYAARAREDGFAGMLAIHPAQIDIINDTFLPTDAEIDRAKRIVDLFAASPGVGTLSIDGQMIDRPHLVQAEKVLRIAKEHDNN